MDKTPLSGKPWFEGANFLRPTGPWGGHLRRLVRKSAPQQQTRIDPKKISVAYVQELAFLVPQPVRKYVLVEIPAISPEARSGGMQWHF